MRNCASEGALSASPGSISPRARLAIDSGLSLREPRNDDGERLPYDCDWLCHWPGRAACSTLTATVSVSVPPP